MVILHCSPPINTARQVVDIHINTNDVLLDTALFEELSVEEYERLNRVNYLGVIYTIKAGTVNMLKRLAYCCHCKPAMSTVFVAVYTVQEEHMPQVYVSAHV